MMKCIRALESMENMVRPVVYLGGGIDGCEDWQEGAVEGLRGMLTKGTILNPRAAKVIEPGTPDAAEWARWNYKALDAANVISYWFGAGGRMPELALFDMGRVVGRYHVGGGPNRVVVGAHPDCDGRVGLKARLDVSNETLQGPWKIPVHRASLTEHLEKVAAAILSL